MESLARSVGRRKEAVAQVQMIRGTGKLIINNKEGHDYLQNDSCAILSVQAPFEIYKKRNFKTEAITAAVAPVDMGSQASNSSAPSGQNGLGLGSNQNTGSFGTDMGKANALILDEIDTIVKVKGGGLKGQADAIRLGIARALCLVATGFAHDSNVDTTAGMVVVLKKQLKDKGYLTQDARVKERRKYGLKKARKASQYHKR